MTREEAKDYLLDIANCMGTLSMEYYNEIEPEETRDQMVSAIWVLYRFKEENDEGNSSDR